MRSTIDDQSEEPVTLPQMIDRLRKSRQNLKFWPLSIQVGKSLQIYHNIERNLQIYFTNL